VRKTPRDVIHIFIIKPTKKNILLPATSHYKYICATYRNTPITIHNQFRNYNGLYLW
jgi:hypothetical protein